MQPWSYVSHSLCIDLFNRSLYGLACSAARIAGFGLFSAGVTSQSSYGSIIWWRGRRRTEEAKTGRLATLDIAISTPVRHKLCLARGGLAIGLLRKCDPQEVRLGRTCQLSLAQVPLRAAPRLEMGSIYLTRIRAFFLVSHCDHR